ncbi:cytochrome P450 alkane hydroxylase [Purpureocillium lavendulum]|uniref:Cytochrome P450 alkane hydroxylase n=1 Tax=Purpureocillium lavendulum TaxID=1247861 RepID=A0AB34FY87_9HYPO|nr:cytochrome P450 alkane hydroxylase [Purpureocillium lavendulum]
MLHVALTPSNVAIAVPILLLVLSLIQRARLRYRLSRRPGVQAPSLASFYTTSLYYAITGAQAQAQNRLYFYFQGLFKGATRESPDAVEMTFGNRRLIFTREPEHIKTVLTAKFTQYGKGEFFHHIWEPALIRPMFTKERIRDLDIFERWSDVLVAKLPASGQTVDICDLFYRMTLDVTTDFLLGKSVGALDKSSPKSEFSRAFMEVQRAQVMLTILAPLGWFVPRGKYNNGIKYIERFIQPFIEKTLRLTPAELEELSKSDRDFTFLHNIALFSRDPKVIRDQIIAVLLAGRDTTAATLSWTMYELSRYPQVWHKLRQQVLEHIGDARSPTYQDLKNLTYLTHTLNETLRLYPAVPYNLRACVEDSSLPGQLGQPDIKTLEGDVIFYSTLCMQRRRDLYPPTSEKFADPDIFSPERWEHWTPRPWQYVPFNGGPRICIGQNFALTEMAFMLVRILQRYERLEYRGDWSAQFHKMEIVGCPGQGVPVALYEAK